MRAFLAVAAINVALVGAYLWLEPENPFTYGHSRAVVLMACAVLLIGSALLFEFARKLQITLLVCLTTVAAIECLFLAFPDIFPNNVRMFVGGDPAGARAEIVERLPHSPFAKPKPNTLVQIPGYYGPANQFVYEWQSDRRGFKNLPEFAARDQFDIVAVGDSFTEGMGVATEDTWVTLLNRKGYTAYNLGIQGYAPTQFLGAYEQYGRQLAPKWVVIGMLGNVHERERQFFQASHPSQAIGRLIEQDELNKSRPLYLQTKDGYRVPVVIKQRYRLFSTSLVALAAQSINFALHFDIKSGVANADSDARFTSGNRYLGEIAVARLEIDPEELAKSPTWKATERSLARIVELARNDGAAPVLLFFPNRGTAYGNDLPPNASDLVQARMLAAFAARVSILFIDLTPVFREHAAQMPYLAIDGHPSKLGQALIADTIAAHIARR